MENSSDWEQKNLINELAQGRELAKQLQIHLNVPSSSHEARELLVHKILNSYDKALTMLKGNGSASAMGEPQPSGAAIGLSESPRSFSGSPKSEDSDRDFKDPQLKTESKKRKSMPRWTQQVQVCPGTGLEGPLDDGCSWRKYGQKDILGAKYPRGYYKCTHRNMQGCLATKQVQRSDKDPTIFEITYRGSHTCGQGSQFNPGPPSASPLTQEPNTALEYPQQIITQPQQSQQQSQEILLNFKTGLKIITENLDNQIQNQNQNQNQPFETNFHFPSTSNSRMESYFHTENNFSGNYFPPSFVSRATSGSNCFPLSPTQIAGFGETRNLNGSESELTEIVSAATSATNSPTVGLDFPFGSMEQFEPSFSFGYPSFFSNSE